jgi:hypothetical protein
MKSVRTKCQTSKATRSGQKRKLVQGHTIEQLVNIKAPEILDRSKHYRRWDASKTDFSLCDSEIAQARRWVGNIWNRIVDVVKKMAPDVKVLLETIADQIRLLYEDGEHEVLVNAINKWKPIGRRFIDISALQIKKAPAMGGAFFLAYVHAVAKWSSIGNLGRMKLMLESAHEIVENDWMLRVPRGRWARWKLAKAKLRRLPTPRRRRCGPSATLQFRGASLRQNDCGGPRER